MNLKELRRMADLTQFQLAQRCGVSRMRLSLAECGQIELNAKEDSAVRKALLGLRPHKDVPIKVLVE
jgi:transcriptional regulator with XRE-family HTH domain